MEYCLICSGTRFLSIQLPNLLMDSVLIQYCFFTYLTLVELLVLVKIFSPTVTTLAFFLGSSPQYSERKPAAYTTGLPTQDGTQDSDSFVPSLQLRGAKWTKMGSKVWKFSVSIAGKLQPKALGRAELRLSSTKPSLPILTLYTKVTLAEICIWKSIAYNV